MGGDVRLGTIGWGYTDWVGNFYPPKTKSATMLERYAEHFPTVELDTTFYGTPRPSTVAGWHERTPADFMFAAKAPKEITHVRSLDDVADLTTVFCTTLRDGLKEKLGPLLFQFPPSFTADAFGRLDTFLATLPTGDGFRFAVELRDRSWLSGGVRAQLYEMLRGHGVALTLLDWVGWPRFIARTAPFTYLRWLGDRDAVPPPFTGPRVDRTADTASWAAQLAALSADGVDVFGYANNHFTGHSPSFLTDLHLALEKTDLPTERLHLPPVPPDDEADG